MDPKLIPPRPPRSSCFVASSNGLVKPQRRHEHFTQRGASEQALQVEEDSFSTELQMISHFWIGAILIPLLEVPVQPACAEIIRVELPGLGCYSTYPDSECLLWVLLIPLWGRCWLAPTAVWGWNSEAQIWTKSITASRDDRAAGVRGILRRRCSRSSVTDSGVASRKTKNSLPDTKCGPGRIQVVRWKRPCQDVERRGLARVHEREWH
jgi:hypothetical protein